MNYANKIYHLYSNAVEEDFRLEDHGAGAILKEWNTTKLGAKPTLASLDSQVSDADANVSALDREAQRETSGITKKDKLLFQINFDQENRIRVLEGNPPVTKVQYKKALVTLYKTL